MTSACCYCHKAITDSKTTVLTLSTCNHQVHLACIPCGVVSKEEAPPPPPPEAWTTTLMRPLIKEAILHIENIPVQGGAMGTYPYRKEPFTLTKA